MPQGKYRKKAFRPAALQSQVKLMDDLAEFEEFKAEVLPQLRADLRKGMSAKQLREKYMALMEARKISIALGSLEEGVAVQAIKDAQDRQEGRATEKKTITHKYEEIPDEELDAILKSEAEDLNEILN